jgi:hypothetical protein
MAQVGLGHIPLAQVQLDLARLASYHDLTWMQGRVRRIDPVAQRE